jgi:hypothetical protein
MPQLGNYIRTLWRTLLKASRAYAFNCMITAHAIRLGRRPGHPRRPRCPALSLGLPSNHPTPLQRPDVRVSVLLSLRLEESARTAHIRRRRVARQAGVHHVVEFKWS